MKKVLIVEDEPENIEAAQAFFGSIEGYDFVYAANRIEAEALLQEADMVITDRSFPADDSGDKLGCGIDIDKHPYYFPYNQLQSWMQANGYWVLLMSHKLGKPAIMASWHRYFDLFLALDSSYPDLENAFRNYSGLSLEETLIAAGEADHLARHEVDFSDLDGLDQEKLAAFVQLRQFAMQEDKVQHIQRIDGCKKTDPTTWQKIWEKLLEQL